jgi:predicted DNA-binding transcriptional regulator AlpA
MPQEKIKNLDDLDDIVTVNELAAFLKWRPESIRNAMSRKTFPIRPVRIGSSVRFYKKAIEAFVSGETPCQS